METKIFDKLTYDLVVALKEKNNIRRDNIKFLLGRFQNEATNKEKIVDDQKAMSIIKNIYKSIKEVTIPNTTNEEELNKSLDFINLCDELLPKQATEEEIRNYLNTVDFSKLKSKMQAVGMTVKYFNGNAEGSLISNILKKY